MTQMDFPLDFPLVSVEAWQLSQQLTGRKTRYSWQNTGLDLAPGLLPGSIDLQLMLHWQGHPVVLASHQSALAQWLAPQLQEAALMTLPQPLLLGLLERESASLPMIIWDNITLLPTPQEKPKPTLTIRLSRGADTLMLWLMSAPEVVLAGLARRPLAECLPVPLTLSLQLDQRALSLSQLRKTEPGDVLLLNPQLTPDAPLLGVVLGCRWCRFHLNQSTLEVIHMQPSTPHEPEQLLSTLDELAVSVGFEVGRKSLDLHTLAHLQPGSLLSLDTPLNGEVRLLVNHHCLGVGRLVNIQGSLGIQIINLYQDKTARHDTAS